MPDFNVIADVSRTLESVRSAGFSTLLPTPPPVAEVHELQGNISINPARLTLFLLEVTWSGDRFTDHQILGRTLQVLYDGAI